MGRGAGGGEDCTATPEESDSYNDITIAGNLPVPRACENEEGLVRSSPPPPNSLSSPQHVHTDTEPCVHTQNYTQEMYVRCCAYARVGVHVTDNTGQPTGGPVLFEWQSKHCPLV